jgi:hypothetical protein
MTARFQFVMQRSLKYSLPLLAFAVGAPAAAGEPGSCPVTVPAADLLGEPFPPSERWYGSEALAVLLPPEGIWRGMGPESNFADKFFWWSLGFKPGLEPNLQVSAKSLDDPGKMANISSATNAHAPSLGGWTMLVGVAFPSPGCWEITGRYFGQTLSFVVDVRADPQT